VPSHSELIADLATIAALLNCWRRALPQYCDNVRQDLVADVESASRLQVSMSGICELLDTASAAFMELIGPDMPVMALMYAHRVAENVDGTLWQMGIDSEGPPIDRAVLDLAAQYVQRQIAQALQWLQRAPGAEVPTWALKADDDHAELATVRGAT